MNEKELNTAIKVVDELIKINKEIGRQKKEQLLLKYAKEKYPIGTKIESLLGSKDIVSTSDFIAEDDMLIYADSGNRQIYGNGKWAEIINETKKDEVNSKRGVKCENQAEWDFVRSIYGQSPTGFKSHLMLELYEDKGCYTPIESHNTTITFQQWLDEFDHNEAWGDNSRTKKWSVGTYVVFLKEFVNSKIGDIDEIIESNENISCDNEGLCTKEEEFVKWFATKKEAEKFALTLQKLLIPDEVNKPKSEFKVGDWIFDTSDSTNTIGKITKIKYEYPYCDMWYSENGISGNGGSCPESTLRLATPEEIAIVAKSTISRETYPKSTEITQTSFDRNFHVKVKNQEEADAMFKWLESKGESIWHTNRGLKWDKNWTYIGFSGRAWKTAENHMLSIEKSPEKPLSDFITIPAPTSSSTNFDNCKIWIGDNPELSRKVQEKLFELGFEWSQGKEVQDYKNAWIYNSLNNALYQTSNNTVDLSLSKCKEITPEDLGIESIIPKEDFTISNSDPEVCNSDDPLNILGKQFKVNNGTYWFDRFENNEYYVCWDNNATGTDYTKNQVKEYLEDGSWKLVDEPIRVPFIDPYSWSRIDHENHLGAIMPEPKVSEIKDVQPLKRVEVKKFKVKSI